MIEAKMPKMKSDGMPSSCGCPTCSALAKAFDFAPDATITIQRSIIDGDVVFRAIARSGSQEKLVTLGPWACMAIGATEYWEAECKTETEGN